MILIFPCSQEAKEILRVGTEKLSNWLFINTIIQQNVAEKKITSLKILKFEIVDKSKKKSGIYGERWLFR